MVKKRTLWLGVGAHACASAKRKCKDIAMSYQKSLPELIDIVFGPKGHRGQGKLGRFNTAFMKVLTSPKLCAAEWPDLHHDIQELQRQIDSNCINLIPEDTAKCMRAIGVFIIKYPLLRYHVTSQSRREVFGSKKQVDVIRWFHRLTHSDMILMMESAFHHYMSLVRLIGGCIDKLMLGVPSKVIHILVLMLKQNAIHSATIDAVTHLKDTLSRNRTTDIDWGAVTKKFIAWEAQVHKDTMWKYAELSYMEQLRKYIDAQKTHMYAELVKAVKAVYGSDINPDTLLNIKYGWRFFYPKIPENKVSVKLAKNEILVQMLEFKNQLLGDLAEKLKTKTVDKFMRQNRISPRNRDRVCELYNECGGALRQMHVMYRSVCCVSAVELSVDSPADTSATDKSANAA